MSVLLSVAVISFNTRVLTLRCLEATTRATLGAEAVLTVVDNGSTDDTVEAVRQSHPSWRVIVIPENPGYGAALNRAFREAPGRFLLALNSDILLDPGALSPLLDFLRRHPQCALVGPMLTYPDGPPQASVKRFPNLTFALSETLWLHRISPLNRLGRRFYYAEQDLGKDPWVDTVSGAAMLIRGEVFARVGGFDEGFRMYFEETDLCRRLQGAGFAVAFCPEARAVHWHGASTIQTSVRHVEYYLSYVRYFRKHHGPGAARLLAAAIAVSTAGRMLGLVVKYPPLSPRRAATLGPKLAACRRLLGALWGSAAATRPAEAHP